MAGRGFSIHVMTSDFCPPYSNFSMESSPVSLRRIESERKKNVCLVDSLRSLGVPVPYSGDGPFYALADGNIFLSPYGNLSSAL